jgi:predicted transcriptional regulator
MWSRHEGRLEGVAMILDMSPSRVDRIRAMMRRVEAGEDVTKEELEAVNKDNNNDPK